ncbi:MAG: hypothetical protein HYV16_12420 [Gammaproteobacteria bacterium]|nr:hypothetical protein [Gammaproteobacteria bacterium]
MAEHFLARKNPMRIPRLAAATLLLHLENACILATAQGFVVGALFLPCPASKRPGALRACPLFFIISQL